MSDVILSDKILSSSAYSHVVAAPIEKIDIADWLFNLRKPSISAAVRPTT